MFFVEMRVLISQPPAQFSGSSVMGILQIGRDREVPGLFHQFLCRKNGVDRRIALGGAGHISGSLGQKDLGLGEADPLTCQRTGNRDTDRLRIRVPHILRRTDHDPAGDEFGILSRFQHSGQIVDGCIGVRSPHTLDKSRDRVVMIVSTLIIAGRPPLDTLLGYVQGNVDLSVAGGFGCQHTQFHCAQGPPCIPVRHIRQKIGGVIVDGGIVHAHTLFIIIDCAQDQPAYVFL